MHKIANLETSKKPFMAELKKMQISVHGYQIAEVIFRHAMMGIEGARYEYKGDKMCRELFDPHLPDDHRVRLVHEYIRDWERSHHGMFYGFEEYHVDEFVNDLAKIDTFNAVADKLVSVAQDSDGLIDSAEVKRWISEIRNRVEKDSLTTLRNRYYAKPEKGTHGLQLIGPQHHDYFKHYISFGSSIFQSIAGKKVEKFLSIKIKREHPNVGEVQRIFSRQYINDRLRKTDEFKKLSKLPTEMGLVTEQFETYLWNLNRVEFGQESRHHRAA